MPQTTRIPKHTIDFLTLFLLCMLPEVVKIARSRRTPWSATPFSLVSNNCTCKKTQVVLAILLENFVSAQQQEDAREAKYALGKIFEGDEDSGGIDDVLGEMMKFPSSIAMNKGIIRMFCFFDSREIGKIGFREIRHGLKKLNTPRMCLINLEGYKRLMRGEYRNIIPYALNRKPSTLGHGTSR
jgi:hypothetical protein